ncbi:hypothetical protein Ahy_B10g105995 [Arachis hypogaea]|uniref:PB1-like domain-containing protein n=1 Tax=Arachis hypogaea TaxID=3818 RepID=A0A444X9J2_ARAHY|nr:hypothetical protein Ahy_B10g105995 [Arachis hypogaea]
MTEAVLGEKRAGKFGLLEGRDLNSFGCLLMIEWRPKYVGGETTIIEEIDCDRWSVFEAYAQVKQFGYVEDNISTLWFKDPILEDMEKKLKLFKGDADLIAMCKIAELRDYVELFIVHKVEEDHGMVDKGEGQEMVVYVGKQAGQNQSEPGVDYTRAKTRDSDDDDNHEAEFGNFGDSDSLNSGYKPSEDEDDSTYNLYFTNNKDELDPDVSGFEDVNVMTDRRRVVKKKGVATENFENDEGANSDELDLDHEVGVEGLDSDHEGVRYPEEFKDTVTVYAVQTARKITFRKCDLKRVRTFCSCECLFWLYAVKMGEEDTCSFTT